MKESIGNALVSGIVLFFVSLLLFILVAAINYSRANKIKNRIVNLISSYAELNTTKESDGIDLDSNLGALIDAELAKVGYRINNGGFNNNKCTRSDGIVLNPNSLYHYCVYKHNTKRGYYYGVETFMYFDIPIIGTTLEFPVYGETRIIYNLDDLGNNSNGQNKQRVIK